MSVPTPQELALGLENKKLVTENRELRRVLMGLFETARPCQNMEEAEASLMAMQLEAGKALGECE